MSDFHLSQAPSGPNDASRHSSSANFPIAHQNHLDYVNNSTGGSNMMLPGLQFSDGSGLWSNQGLSATRVEEEEDDDDDYYGTSQEEQRETAQALADETGTAVTPSTGNAMQGAGTGTSNDNVGFAPSQIAPLAENGTAGFTLPGLGDYSTRGIPADASPRDVQVAKTTKQKPDELHALSRTSKSASTSEKASPGIDRSHLSDLLERQYAFAIQTLRELHSCGISFEQLVMLDILDDQDKADLAVLFQKAGLAGGKEMDPQSLNRHLLKMSSRPTDNPQVRPTTKDSSATSRINGSPSSHRQTFKVHDRVRSVSKSGSSIRSPKASEPETVVLLPASNALTTGQRLAPAAPSSSQSPSVNAPRARSDYLAKLQAAKLKKSPLPRSEVGSPGTTAGATPPLSITAPSVSLNLGLPPKPPSVFEDRPSKPNGQNVGKTSEKSLVLEQRLAALRQQVLKSRTPRKQPNVQQVGPQTTVIAPDVQTRTEIAAATDQHSNTVSSVIDHGNSLLFPSLDSSTARFGTPYQSDLQRPTSTELTAPAPNSSIGEPTPRSSSQSANELYPNEVRPDSDEEMDIDSGEASPINPGLQHEPRGISSPIPLSNATSILTASADRNMSVFPGFAHVHSQRIPAQDEDESARRERIALKAKERLQQMKNTRSQVVTPHTDIVPVPEIADRKNAESSGLPVFENTSTGLQAIVESSPGVLTSTSVLKPASTLGDARADVANGVEDATPETLLSVMHKRPASGPLVESDVKRVRQDLASAESLKESHIAAKKRQLAEYQRRMQELEAEINANREANFEEDTNPDVRASSTGVYASTLKPQGDPAGPESLQQSMSSELTTSGDNDIASASLTAPAVDPILPPQSVPAEGQSELQPQGLAARMGSETVPADRDTEEQLMHPQLSTQVSMNPNPVTGKNDQKSSTDDSTDDDDSTHPSSSSNEAQSPLLPTAIPGNAVSPMIESDDAYSPSPDNSPDEDGEIIEREAMARTDNAVDDDSRVAEISKGSEGPPRRESLTDESMSVSSGEIPESPQQPELQASTNVSRVDISLPPRPPTQSRNVTIEPVDRVTTRRPPANAPTGPRRGPAPQGPRFGPPKLPILGLPQTNTPQQKSKNIDENPYDVAKPNTADYRPYQSPLRMFKQYRYHPDYSANASGYQSLTYSHKLDTQLPLCATELKGEKCQDPDCVLQHLDKAQLDGSTLLAELGGRNPGRTPEEQTAYSTGLRTLILDMKARNLIDAEQIAGEIVEYRRKFLQDPSRVLDV